MNNTNKILVVIALLIMIPAVLLINPSFLPKRSIDYQNDSRQPIATIQFQRPNLRKPMVPGAQFGVNAVQVKDGYRFRLLLDNNQWIEAHLPHATRNEAVPVVVDLFKTSSHPTVVLYRQTEDCWIVDVNFNVQGSRRSLTQILQVQGLAY